MAPGKRLFSHMSERLSGTLTSVGLAGVIGLAIGGEGLLAALLLAGFGAAAAVLIVSGVLRLRPKESRTETRLREIFGALPSALAVTDRRGALLWKSDTFMKAIGGLGLEQDLTRLGERNQEAASAMFRLFAAARAGHVHLEAIRLPQSPGDEHYTLKVSPLVEHGQRARTFIWELKEADGARNAEEPGAAAILNKVPLPAFSIAKDLSVEGANKNFEALLGRSPAGEQAWSLFSTKRGKPLTRAWLRDMIAKGGDQTSARLSSPGGAAHLLTLSFSKDAGGRVLCIAVPAGMGVELEDGFDQLLPYAPLPMALLNPKGVIQTANVAFHQLFDSSCLGGATGLLGKPLQSLVSEASSKNIRDKITAVLAAAHNPQSQTVELQVELLDPGSKRLRLVMFLAAQGNKIIVAASSAESAALMGEQTAQGQKLQAVGELAGGIAHDFNNLLTAIIGFSDLLLRRFRASDPAFKDLMNIKNNATRAAELVKQILAYSRKQTLRPAILESHGCDRGIPGNHGPNARREGQGQGSARPRSLVREGGRGPALPGNHEPCRERTRRDAERRRNPDYDRERRRARIARAEGPRPRPRRIRDVRGARHRAPASSPSILRKSSTRSSRQRKWAKAPGLASPPSTAS